MKYHRESSFAWEGELVWILAIAKTVDTMLGYAKLRLSRPFFWFNQTLPWYYRVMGKTVGMHTESFDHVRPLLMPRALPLVEWIFFVRRGTNKPTSGVPCVLQVFEYLYLEVLPVSAFITLRRSSDVIAILLKIQYFQISLPNFINFLYLVPTPHPPPTPAPSIFNRDLLTVELSICVANASFPRSMMKSFSVYEN